jgi:threonine dehydrogenase-like Zn-dependent dehydrogenase
MPFKLILIEKRKLAFEEYQDAPLLPSCVLLKTIYSAISHGSESLLFEGNAPKFEYSWDSDLRQFSAQMPSSNSGPYSIGYESVAKVVQIGSAVQGWVT